MGQVLQRIHDIEKQEEHINKPNNAVTKFQDLQNLPPEIGLAVLSHLNATDLCLAACVWDTLANDEILWMGYYVTCLLKLEVLILQDNLQ